MLINLTGFILAYTIVLHIWVIWIVSGQKVSSLLAPLYIYLNVLLGIVELASLFFFQMNDSILIETIFKIHYVTEVFIPPILIFLSETYLKEMRIPSFSLKNILFFITSFILSVLGFTNFTIDGLISHNQMTIPGYTPLYWLVIIYYYFSFGYILFDFLEKYQNEKRQQESDNIRFMLIYILPVSVLLFTSLKLLPMWGIIQPLIFLTYALISFAIFSIAYKFDIIDFDDTVSRSISFFAVSIFVLIPLAIILPPLNTYLFLSIIIILLGFFSLFRIVEKLKVKKLKESFFN